MIRGMLVLLVATCLGELLRQVLQVRISGPVLGMALLVVLLLVTGGPRADLQALADQFLRHLGVLFIPAGVVQYLDEIGRDWLMLLCCLVVSSALSLVAAALAGRIVLRAIERPRRLSGATVSRRSPEIAS